MNEYEKQANDFLKKTETTFSAKYLFTGKHFDEDTEDRPVYWIELKNKNHVYRFNFGQSIASMWPHYPKKYGYREEGITPTAYDVLSCLSGSIYAHEMDFQDFCDCYGYSNDSKKAEQTFYRVKVESENVHKLFADFIDELAEIQ